MATQRPANDPFGDQQLPAGNGRQSESAGAASGNDSASPANRQAQNPSDEDPDMAYYHSFLSKLLDLISNEEEEVVARVVSVIQSGASHRQILDMIEQSSGNDSPAGCESNGVSNSSQ
ncbi:hypothetical protein N7492_003106 [Penicillium capsulatum]|uniref:Uncharacterized protein n=1 Tax=Penicillium capsulatum TaxID=69766 RepID=A0A9W9IQE1_9EURO|nr:hypothetical protein N7492_003106 [Penicillium capsulatum]KAJ6122303.1 hypothetical protein N7512_004768 [Penicillium capsulatum]